jgi:hypothetical protein
MPTGAGPAHILKKSNRRQQGKKRVCAFLSPWGLRSNPQGLKNRAFRSNLFCAMRKKGFPLQSRLHGRAAILRSKIATSPLRPTG